jgi:YesN/AraC family two-component response regulator
VQPDEFREFLKRYVMPVPKNIQGKSEPHILIVDDDEGIHKGLERIFHNMEEKFHIHKAYNGYEACVLIGRHPLSLAIIDLMMPNMNGMELCEIIRSMEETKDLPILIISGFIDDEKIEKLTKLQVENFLSKPFSHQKLTKTVKRILEENKA